MKPVADALGTAPIMVLMTDERVEQQFDVAEIGQRKYLYWVELTPKQADMEFTTVYLGMEDDIIKAMELRDAFGQSTQIVFENLRTDMVFDPQTFRFEPPPGVDVFGAGG